VTFNVTTTGSPPAAIRETGRLPLGLFFVSSAGGVATVFGTPSQSGRFVVAFTASNGVGSPATQLFTLVVRRAP
jgi:large repetitive protein